MCSEEAEQDPSAAALLTATTRSEFPDGTDARTRQSTCGRVGDPVRVVE